MKNVFHKKCRNWETNPSHVESPPILLIKETYNGKSDKYFVKLKLRRDHKSSTMELYEFNMSLFDQGERRASVVYTQLQHDFLSNRNAVDGHTGSVSLYASR